MLPTLSPQEFVDKWRPATLQERSAASTPDQTRQTETDVAGAGTPEAGRGGAGGVRVAARCGDEEMLERLLALNLERSEG